MNTLKHLSFRIRPASPFRLDLTAWALRRRKENIIDRWDGMTFRRVLVLNGRPVQVKVLQQGPPERPVLRVEAKGADSARQSKVVIKANLERMLGLRKELGDFYSFVADDGRIGLLANRFLGVKPPRFPTLFEAVANGIACQQLSLTVGIILLNRLAEKYGASFMDGEEISYSFALPERLARAEIMELKRLGYSGQKSRYLIELAQRAITEGPDLGDLASLDNQTALQRLYRFRGVGRWTGEYVLLRGFGRTDVFPVDDVGARNKLQRMLRLKDLDYEGVKKITNCWQPYGGLIYFHLLLDGLAGEGYVREKMDEASDTNPPLA